MPPFRMGSAMIANRAWKRLTSILVLLLIVGGMAIAEGDRDASAGKSKDAESGAAESPSSPATAAPNGEVLGKDGQVPVATLPGDNTDDDPGFAIASDPHRGEAKGDSRQGSAAVDTAEPPSTEVFAEPKKAGDPAASDPQLPVAKVNTSSELPPAAPASGLQMPLALGTRRPFESADPTPVPPMIEARIETLPNDVAPGESTPGLGNPLIVERRPLLCGNRVRSQDAAPAAAGLEIPQAAPSGSNSVAPAENSPQTAAPARTDEKSSVAPAASSDAAAAAARVTAVQEVNLPKNVWPQVCDLWDVLGLYPCPVGYEETSLARHRYATHFPGILAVSEARFQVMVPAMSAASDESTSSRCIYSVAQPWPARVEPKSWDILPVSAVDPSSDSPAAAATLVAVP